MTKTLAVAKRPCASCPYRKDAPSGLWARHEYDKLLSYDGEIIDQLKNGAVATFWCHQRNGKLCAGWIATHGAANLLAMQLNAPKVPRETWEYTTDVPLFGSGAEARKHGLKDLKKPGRKAVRLMDALVEKGLAKE
jgi:Family of unknown function (DUF6283)